MCTSKTKYSFKTFWWKRKVQLIFVLQQNDIQEVRMNWPLMDRNKNTKPPLLLSCCTALILMFFQHLKKLQLSSLVINAIIGV